MERLWITLWSLLRKGALEEVSQYQVAYSVITVRATFVGCVRDDKRRNF
jgi:hypothetical protein